MIPADSFRENKREGNKIRISIKKERLNFYYSSLGTLFASYKQTLSTKLFYLKICNIQNRCLHLQKDTTFVLKQNMPYEEETLKVYSNRSCSSIVYTYLLCG